MKPALMKSLCRKLDLGMALLLATTLVGRAESRPPEGVFEWTNMNDATRYHIEQTEYLLKRGALDDASLELQQALSIWPDHPTLLRWAAELYTDRGQYAMAEGYYARLSELFPSNSWVFSHWGGVFSQMGRFDQAEQPLRRALELDPADLTARYHLACLYLLNGQSSQAGLLLKNLDLDEIRQLADWIHGERDTLPMRIGSEPLRTLCRLILTGQAETATEAADETGPEEWMDRMGLVAETLRKAQLAMKSEQWAEARQHWDAVLAAGLQAPQARREHAVALYRLGEKALALDEFQQLDRDHPHLPGLQQIYGLLLLEERRFAEAEKVLASAWEKDQTQPQTAFALICAYAVQQRYTDARDVARSLPSGPAGQIAAWIREGHPYREYLQGHPELLEWLQSRGSEPTAE